MSLQRGDVVWADLGPPAGRRPVCVLTRSPAIPVLTALTCAPITRTVRGIASEVDVGNSEGLPEDCVVACDSLITVAVRSLDAEPVGQLGLDARSRLDQALRYTLDIRY